MSTVPTPIDKVLQDLVDWSAQMVDDPLARRYLLVRLKPIFSDVGRLQTMLIGPQEWNNARELAATALHASEMDGNVEYQKLFLYAICRLAPITSTQFLWANQRLDSLEGKEAPKRKL